MSWEMNPYYSPDKFELFIVDSLELDDEPYQFNMIVVWRHAETEKLYWACDSGCSCPSPFEDYTKLEDLSELSKYDYPQIERIVKDSRVRGSHEASYFLREVEAAIEML